jgi:DNA-binding MarR family transcriptional regulator
LTELEELLLHSKPVKILVHLNNPSTDNYPSQIAKDIDCTYSHTVRITQRLEDHSLINAEKNGRKKQLQLTDKGEKISKVLSELLHILRTSET